VRLLIVEDDDIVADAIARGLTAANYDVHRVSNAESAQAALADEEFALAVIDVGLPGTDGLSLVRRLRTAGKTLPTLILTARCTLADKVKALDLGADDFMSKPFEPAELAARCRALMRRASGALNGIVELNRLSADLARKSSSPHASGWYSNVFCGASA
jgi:two-component system OmpR family response regulator